MTSVIDIYERLRTAPDDATRARVIAEAFEQLEDRYPEIKDLATSAGLRETELRLLKEIEQLRADLTTEIEQVRGEIKETELKLTREIEQGRMEGRLEIERLRADLVGQIGQLRFSLIRWVVGLFGAQVVAMTYFFLRLSIQIAGQG